MQIWPQKIQYLFKGGVYLGLAILFVSVGSGCASIHKARTKKIYSNEAAANEKAKFKRSGEVFNNKANEEIRANSLAEKEAAEATEATKKAEEAQDKGEGQVQVKF